MLIFISICCVLFIFMHVLCFLEIKELAKRFDAFETNQGKREKKWQL